MSIGRLFLLLFMAFISACNMEDLAPSGEDRRGSTVEVVADFTLQDVDGNDFTLSDYLASGSQPSDAIVLYFTMWCPTCLDHTDILYNQIVPTFAGRGTVQYVLVDYVSGDWQNARWIAQSNGYLGTSFTIIADVQNRVKEQLHGSMGMTVVINPQGEIVMNEEFRSGANLQATLESMLPAL